MYNSYSSEDGDSSTHGMSSLPCKLFIITLLVNVYSGAITAHNFNTVPVPGKCPAGVNIIMEMPSQI